MLIVSKVLLSREYEYGAWQLDESKKRDAENYVVVTKDLCYTVAKSVFKTALALDLHEHMSMRSILGVLGRWLQVSEEEEKVWLKVKSVNAPIFDPKLWEERKEGNRRAEVRVYDNTVDLVLAIAGTVRA